MNIWLVRHGNAVSDTVDPERPLSAEGRREVEAVARVLTRAGGIRPAAVIHSGKTRARQTAEILAGALGVAEALEQADGLAPEADPAVWAKRLEKRSDVMLVGHLPHMEGLVALLVGAPTDAAPARLITGSVVCLTREGRHGPWSIAWMVTPDVAH
jgi:phosphohistidine phosphatase